MRPASHIHVVREKGHRFGVYSDGYASQELLPDEALWVVACLLMGKRDVPYNRMGRPVMSAPTTSHTEQEPRA